MSKKIDQVRIDRLRALWLEYGFPPKVLSERLGLPKRTVFHYLKQFKEVEGLCTTTKWQENG